MLALFVCLFLSIFTRGVNSQEGKTPTQVLGFLACPGASPFEKQYAFPPHRSADPEVCHIHNKATASASCLVLACL